MHGPASARERRVVSGGRWARMEPKGKLAEQHGAAPADGRTDVADAPLPAAPFNLPNCITLARVLSVPIVFWLLLSRKYQAAFFLFALAGISDAVDGWLAKRYKLQTELGAYLDPLADKLLVVCIFVAMGWLGELPLWLVIAVVSRDLLIITGVMLAWLLDHPVRIRPLVVSKANTFAQLLLASCVLADTGFNLGLGGLRDVLVAVTALLTLASLWAYTVAWLRHMTGSEPAH